MKFRNRKKFRYGIPEGNYHAWDETETIRMSTQGVAESCPLFPDVLCESDFVYIICLSINITGVSSGSIVSDYGLDDRAIGVRSPAGAKDFFCVQTGCGTHPATCPMGTGGPFPGGKSVAGA
jgi:hypothetical protein